MLFLRRKKLGVFTIERWLIIFNPLIELKLLLDFDLRPAKLSGPPDVDEPNVLRAGALYTLNN